MASGNILIAETPSLQQLEAGVLRLPVVNTSNTEIHPQLNPRATSFSRRIAGQFSAEKLESGVFVAIRRKETTEGSPVLPKPDDVEQYSQHLDREDEAKIAAEYRHFMAEPWYFFHKKLMVAGLESPVDEIVTKSKRISETIQEKFALHEVDLQLLRSPYKMVREAAYQNLLDAGFTDIEIVDSRRTASAQLDVAQLEFSIPVKEWDTSEKFPPEFHTFLINSIEHLMQESLNQKELGQFCSYLLNIIEAFQYRYCQFKIEDHAFLEEFLEKLKKNILTKRFTAMERTYLSSLWDVLSHFEISENVGKDIIKIMDAVGEQSHPLRWFLKPSLLLAEIPTMKDERVGLEVEGIPHVYLPDASIPGFSIGVDGGGTQFEIRRNSEELEYSEAYVRQLFELWYWCRMSRFNGVSVHIHLDETDPQNKVVYDKFVKIFGDNYSTLRSRGKKVYSNTVELRLNLPAYGHATMRTDLGFFPPAFDFSTLLADMLCIKYAENVDFQSEQPRINGRNAIAGSNPYWRTRYHSFGQRKDGRGAGGEEDGLHELTDLEFQNFIQTRIDDGSPLREILKDYYYGHLISTRRWLQIAELVKWDTEYYDILTTTIYILQTNQEFDHDDFFYIAEKINWNSELMSVILCNSKLPFSDLIPLVEQNKLSLEDINSNISSFDVSTITNEVLMFYLKRLKPDPLSMKTLIQQIPHFQLNALDFWEIVQIGKISVSSLRELVAYLPDESLTPDDINNLFSVLGADIVGKAIKKIIPGLLTVDDLVFYDKAKSDFNTIFGKESLTKLRRDQYSTENIGKILEICDHQEILEFLKLIPNDSLSPQLFCTIFNATIGDDLVDVCLSKLRTSALSFVGIYYIYMHFSFSKNMVLKKLLESAPEEETSRRILLFFAKQTKWSSDISELIIGRLRCSSWTAQQIVDFIATEKPGSSFTQQLLSAATTVVFSDDQLKKLFQISRNKMSLEYVIMRGLQEKIDYQDGTVGRLIQICEICDWTVGVIDELLNEKKFKTTQTRFLEIARQLNDDPTLLRIIIPYLDYSEFEPDWAMDYFKTHQWANELLRKVLTESAKPMSWELILESVKLFTGLLNTIQIMLRKLEGKSERNVISDIEDLVIASSRSGWRDDVVVEYCRELQHFDLTVEQFTSLLQKATLGTSALSELANHLPDKSVSEELLVEVATTKFEYQLILSLYAKANFDQLPVWVVLEMLKNVHSKNNIQKVLSLLPKNSTTLDEVDELLQCNPDLIQYRLNLIEKSTLTLAEMREEEGRVLKNMYFEKTTHSGRGTVFKIKPDKILIQPPKRWTNLVRLSTS